MSELNEREKSAAKNFRTYKEINSETKNKKTLAKFQISRLRFFFVIKVKGESKEEQGARDCKI